MGAAVPCLSEEQNDILLKLSVMHWEYGTDKKEKRSLQSCRCLNAMKSKSFASFQCHQCHPPPPSAHPALTQSPSPFLLQFQPALTLDCGAALRGEVALPRPPLQGRSSEMSPFVVIVREMGVECRTQTCTGSVRIFCCCGNPRPQLRDPEPISWPLAMSVPSLFLPQPRESPAPSASGQAARPGLGLSTASDLELATSDTP